MTAGTVLLAAGGTGGHLFPAAALADVLSARGHAVHLVTDPRGAAFKDSFPARNVFTVSSDTVRGRSPVSLSRTAFRLSGGFLASRKILRETSPDVTVGFGGYPTLPPLLASRVRGIPIVLHEQNAVMGRANRALARLAHSVAFGFPPKPGTTRHAPDRIHVTGNPVRPAVIEASATPYDDEEPHRLLVFGGSQGARVFSDVVPAAVAELQGDLRARLNVTQQARPEDEERVRGAYAKIGVQAEVAPFFADMPARIAGASLVIGRAGASTVSELATIGRPSLLVPLPHALDNDQGENARLLEASGGARVVDQAHFTASNLARDLQDMLSDPDGRTAMAQAAAKAGAHHAAERLADLVETIMTASGP